MKISSPIRIAGIDASCIMNNPTSIISSIQINTLARPNFLLHFAARGELYIPARYTTEIKPIQVCDHSKWLLQQMIADVIEYRDKTAHQNEPLHKKQAQLGISYILMQ